jgi:hypothetical protein
MNQNVKNVFLKNLKKINLLNECFIIKFKFYRKLAIAEQNQQKKIFKNYKSKRIWIPNNVVYVRLEKGRQKKAARKEKRFLSSYLSKPSIFAKFLFLIKKRNLAKIEGNSFINLFFRNFSIFYVKLINKFYIARQLKIQKIHAVNF